MSDHGITRENLLRIVPPALTHDKSVMALAEADAEVLAARRLEIDKARVIANIDGLDEAVLDILARDFKVDWWDADYSLEEKRRTLKSSWRVHKTLGTKGAVETAISAIYPGTKVQEWWEYGGEPYHFRLDINIGSDTINSEKHRRVLERVNYYKSLRSHLDGIKYTVSTETVPAHAAATRAGSYTRIGVRVPVYGELAPPKVQTRATAGAAMSTGFYRRIQTTVKYDPFTQGGERS